MRTIIAHRSIEKYLQKCAAERKFSFGLVIGQPSSHNKDYVIHIAKNSDCHETEEEIAQHLATEEESSTSIKGLEDLNDNSLSHHVMSVIKMIPGSFFILGIFFVDDFNIYENKVLNDKVVFLINNINQVFKANKYLCGNSKVLGNDKMIMYYNSTTQTTSCRYFDFKNKNFVCAECVFLEKPIDWTLFETNYELDEVFPIIEKKQKLNIETHFTSTLDTINVFIKHSKIFIQDEPVDDTIVLENYLKKNQIKPDIHKGISVSIFLISKTSDEDSILIEAYDGVIRYSGIIASRIWGHPKSSFRDIYDYIRNDIMRSMASRIQVYCDGLIDPNAANDPVVINEPPRRVFFDNPEGNGIQFCDYIFVGEALSVVIAQAEHLLNLQIEQDDINDAVEGNPEDDDFGFTKLPNPLNRQTKFRVREYGHIMFMAGLATAIFVLLISIILNFIFR